MVLLPYAVDGPKMFPPVAVVKIPDDPPWIEGRVVAVARALAPEGPAKSPTAVAANVPAAVSAMILELEVAPPDEKNKLPRVNQLGRLIDAISAGAPLVRTVMFFADNTIGKP